MLSKLFKFLSRHRAAQQQDLQPPTAEVSAVEPPTAEPPAAEVPAAEPPAVEVPPTPATPPGPEDNLRKVVLRVVVEKATAKAFHWFVEEVLPHLF